VPFLHSVRNTVFKHQARAVLYKEPRKDDLSGKDVGRKPNATTA
jgi:hypothetical protein